MLHHIWYFVIYAEKFHVHVGSMSCSFVTVLYLGISHVPKHRIWAVGSKHNNLFHMCKFYVCTNCMYIYIYVNLNFMNPKNILNSKNKKQKNKEWITPIPPLKFNPSLSDVTCNRYHTRVCGGLLLVSYPLSLGLFSTIWNPKSPKTLPPFFFIQVSLLSLQSNYSLMNVLETWLKWLLFGEFHQELGGRWIMWFSKTITMNK